MQRGGGKRGVGKWEEGKKGGGLGRESQGYVFPFVFFSLPPPPHLPLLPPLPPSPLFALVMQATRRAPYSARNFGAHLRARQMKPPATQAKIQIISNCQCILLLSLLAVLPNKGSCTSSSPPVFCFGRRTTNCGDLDALGTY